METRITRKRRWQSSPDKKTARTSLDFNQLENTPPKKKRREVEETNSGTATDTDDSFESVGIKTFYGGKEKKHFPHSPGRRKVVNKVLSKISGDENETSASEDDWLTLKKQRELNKLSGESGTESSPSLTDRKKVLQTRNRSYSADSREIKRKVESKSKTTSPHPRNAKSGPQKTILSPAISALRRENDLPITPPSGKKFFRHKSPASADKAMGSVIIGKGFNLKFIPKRKLSTDSLQKTAPLAKKLRNEPKTKKMAKQSSYETANAHTNDNKEPKILVEKCNIKYSRRDSSHENKTINRVVDQADVESTSDTLSDSGVPQVKDVHVDISSGKQSTEEDSAFQSSTLTNENLSDNNLSNQEDCDKQSINSDTCDIPQGLVGSADLFSASSVSGRSTPTSDNSSDVTSESLSSIRSGPSLRQQTEKKYYPLFTPNSTPKQKTLQEVISKRIRGRKDPKSSPGARMLDVKDDSEQMILDAGQKKWGAGQCEVCGMVFTHGSPVDHTTHAKFHQSLVAALKFPGWKKERVVTEYPEDGGRVIMVLPDDQKYAVKKVEEINKIMGQELGFPDPSLSLRSGYKAFLYVSDDKTVDGCCVAEPVTEGYRVIPDSQPSQSSQQQPGRRPWCCQSDSEPASVGVSRIWVSGQKRRKGVASKLLDSVRHWFDYGVPIDKDQLAFSDPTPDGKILATNYTGTPSFLVYKYS